MGKETFCSDCGHLDSYCVCDVIIQYLEPVEPNFRFEYAMEKLSGHPTQFWDILPEYE
jgi:DTW domain-containing protein YfiP